MPMCLRKEIEVNCMWLEILGKVPHLSLFISPGTLQSTPFSQWPIPSSTRGHHALYVIWPAIILWTPCNKQPWTLSTTHMMESETVVLWRNLILQITQTEALDRPLSLRPQRVPHWYPYSYTSPVHFYPSFWWHEYFSLYTCSINIWPKKGICLKDYRYSCSSANIFFRLIINDSLASFILKKMPNVIKWTLSKLKLWQCKSLKTIIVEKWNEASDKCAYGLDFRYPTPPSPLCFSC